MKYLSLISFFPYYVFLTKSLTLGILFSTAVRAAVIAKIVILGISHLTSFILALREELVAKLVILGTSFVISFILALRVVLAAKLVMSGISSPIFLILALHTYFLTTALHHFITTASQPYCIN